MRLLVLAGCAVLACSTSTGAPAPAVVAGSGSSGAAGNRSNGGTAAGGVSSTAAGAAGFGGVAGNLSGSGVAAGASGSGVTMLGGAAGASTDGGNAGSPSVPLGGGGASGASGTSGAAGAAGGPAQPPKASGILCVFDYDLTLSTNACGTNEFACRTNTCETYNWYKQCISSGARHAIAMCVERGAFVGIASHASVDGCWNDKVLPVIAQDQFPELTGALRYDNSKADFSYPKLDARGNWNCDHCAYHMNGSFSKPQLISKVMTHYGMDPSKAADRAKVIFWDDLPDNITKTNADMPEVHTVHVHENIDGQPNSGGCGILDSDVTAGWAPFPP